MRSAEPESMAPGLLLFLYECEGNRPLEGRRIVFSWQGVISQTECAPLVNQHLGKIGVTLSKSVVVYIYPYIIYIYLFIYIIIIIIFIIIIIIYLDIYLYFFTFTKYVFIYQVTWYSISLLGLKLFKASRMTRTLGILILF